MSRRRRWLLALCAIVALCLPLAGCGGGGGGGGPSNNWDEMNWDTGIWQ